MTNTTPSVSLLPPETLAFATKCFDMARSGDTTTLRAYLDQGLPPNLTNEKGALSAEHALMSS